MGTIGTLAVNVVANTASFARDMQQSTSAVRGFESSATASAAGIGGMITKVAGLAGIALGTAEAVHELHKSFEQIEKTALTADRLGATTEELQKLHYAADMVGVAADAMDTGLTKMLQHIGQAADGSQEAASAFLNLGLRAEDLKDKSAGEAFAEIAEQISKIPTPAERAAAAVEIFGKSGASLVNVLNLGKQGLANFGEEAERAGITFSRMDAQKVVEANEAMKALKWELRGLVNSLAIDLAPAVKLAAEGLGAMAKGVGTVLGWFGKLISAVREFGAERGLWESGVEAEKQAKASAEAQEKLAAAMQRGAEITRQLRTPLETYSDTMEELRSLVDANAISADTFDKAWQHALDTLHRADGTTQLFEEGMRLAKQFRTPAEQLADTIADVSKLLRVGAIDWKTYNRAVEDATGKFREATKASHDAEVMRANQGVGAVARGTSAGFSAEQQGYRQMQQQVEEQKRANEELNEANRHLQEIERNTERAGVTVRQVGLL